MTKTGAMLLSCAGLILTGCGGAPSNTPAPAAATPPLAQPAQPLPQQTLTAVPQDFFGMHLQGLGPVPYPSLQFSSVRLWDTAYWGILEPSSEVYNWAPLDQLVSEAKTNGVTDFMFTLGNPPAWALNSDGTANESAVDEFTTTLVQRECGTVEYYETWNEANLASSWPGTQAQLATLARDFYKIVKANCPGAKVLTPSANSISSADGRTWLASWLAQGVPYDIVAFHGYTTQPELTAQDVAWLRALTTQPVWDTEGSWGKESSLTQTEEASWLVRTYLIQASGGVGRFYWYAYGSPTWGAIYSNSAATAAYGTVHGWLDGAQVGCSNSGNTWTCDISNASGEHTVTWDSSNLDNMPREN